MKKQIKPLAAILRFLDFSITRYRHFQQSRELFLALRAFLFPSQKHSRFLLSHIRHYPLLQERSLDFARDDDTGIALSKHIRCTLRGIDPFPHAVIRGTAKNPSCTPSFLAPFASAFSFSAISHRAIYTIPSFRAQREIFLALRAFLLPSQKHSPFPLSHIRRHTDVQERSLHFGRDDNEDGALLSLFSCRHAKECLFEAH